MKKLSLKNRLFKILNINNNNINNYNNIPYSNYQLLHTMEEEGYCMDVENLLDYYSDSRLNSSINQQINAIKTRDYTIHCEDEEKLDFIKYVFNNLDIKYILSKLLKAIYLGFSACEIIYGVDDLQRIIVLDVVEIDRFTLNNGLDNFVYNDDGVFMGLKQFNNNFYNNFNGDVIIPFDKLLLYSYRGSSSNILGEPISYSIFKELKLRRRLLKNIDLITFRYGVPIISANIDSSYENVESVKQQITDIINGKAPGIITDIANKVELLTDSHDHKILTDMVEYVDRIILSSAFSLNERTSARDTDSSINFTRELQFNYLNSLLMDMDKIFNKLIKNIIDYNYEKSTEYPLFKLNPFIANDLKDFIITLNSLKLNKDSDLFKNILNEYISENTNIVVDVENIVFSEESE